MVRKSAAWILTSFVLLAQVGLPLHFHYCKGILEGVAVFFNPGCDEHEMIADLPACCAADLGTDCSRDGGDCCDDRVEVFTQDITSLKPSFEKWNDLAVIAPKTATVVLLASVRNEGPVLVNIPQSNAPPAYILYHSLVYYA